MNSLEKIFEQTYVECRTLFISLYAPSLKNNNAELAVVEGKYLSLVKQLKGMSELHPELQAHPLYSKIQAGKTW